MEMKLEMKQGKCVSCGETILFYEGYLKDCGYCGHVADSQKRSRSRSRLTPIYVVQVASRVPGGIFHKYRRDELGVDEPVPVSADEARKIVARLEKDGKGARAYQHGWGQRGFQSGEPECEELCRSKHWTGWYDENEGSQS